MEDIVAQYLSDLNTGEDTSWVNNHISMDPKGFHRLFVKALKKKDKKEHIYMATFTVDPSKFPTLSESEVDTIQSFIESQAQRTALKLTQFQYVKELHKSGRPHWHALLVSEKPLKKDRFNHFIKKYGHLDLAKNKAQQTTEILNYISKISEPKVLL